MTVIYPHQFNRPALTPARSLDDAIATLRLVTLRADQLAELADRVAERLAAEREERAP